jgi:DNA-binding NtrC family response regulator
MVESRPSRPAIRNASLALITGGTAADRLEAARIIHVTSARQSGPWLVVRCIDGERSDLRAACRRCGDGTLFVDDVGNLSPREQRHLLAVVERPDGAVDGRDRPLVLAGADTPPLDAVAAHRFSRRLYHYLTAVHIDLEGGSAWSV